MKNEYKTICNECYIKTWYETEQPCHCKDCRGTLKLIDNSQLDARFNQYYESGERLEITYKGGRKERGYIGKSTGWKPIWILIKKSNSYSGYSLLCKSITNIKPLNKYRW